MAADRAEGLVGQGDQLGGALRAGEEDQDRCPARAEEAGQAVRDPGPVRVGQGAGAGVDERVALGCVVPGGPARALGDRDEQQSYAGELLRGIVVRVDPEPAPAQPPHPRAQTAQGGRPAAVAQLAGPRDDVRLDDPAAARPVRQDGVQPDPVQDVGGPPGQVVAVQERREGAAAECHRQVRPGAFGGGRPDGGQLLLEGRGALARRRGGEEVRAPAAAEPRRYETGRDRVGGLPGAVGGQVGVEPGPFAGVVGPGPLQGVQGGDGLGEG